MHCFYHTEKEAVGLCKSCAKGICTECAVDLGRGLACRGRCEDTVRKILEVTDLAYQRADKLREPPRPVQPPNQALRQREAHMRSGRFYTGAGVVLLVAGILHDSIVTNLVGAAFAFWGGRSFYWAYRVWRQSKKAEDKKRKDVA